MHHIRPWSAAALLIVMMGGGVLGPLVHHVHHGSDPHRSIAEAAGSEACDHAQHDAAYEVAPASWQDDPCVLCSRQLAASEKGLAVALTTHEPDAQVAGCITLISSAAPLSLSIRGPPSGIV